MKQVSNKNDQILKYSLLVCTGYFICMSLAHFFGIKLPILFIYYDVPFYEYQDKVISFAVVTYALLFYAASQNRALTRYTIASLLATVLGLSFINLSEALNTVIEGATTTYYWIQTGMIAVIAIWITVFYLRSKKNN